MSHETHPVTAYSQGRQVSLCEVLDRVLNKGVVLTGEIVISVADIELLYVGINLLISSVETLLEAMDGGKEKEKEGLDR